MSKTSNMSDRELMTAIYKELSEIQNTNNLINSKFEQLSFELHTKIDILCNFKPAQKGSSDSDSKKKVPSKPIYIKDIIKNNKEEYINILYTQEEYDNCVDIIEQKNIKGKKTDEEKLKQLIEHIYKEVINANTNYKTKATQLHNDYKKKYSEPVVIDQTETTDLNDS
jgi:hypothetical protein